MRKEEQENGSDYVHVSKKELRALKKQGDIIEQVKLYNHYYALPRP